MPVLASEREGWTSIPCRLEAHGSLLFVLEPSTSEARAPARLPGMAGKELSRLNDPVPVTLSEPNVLLLDYAELKVDEYGWTDRLPILDFDALVLKKLGLPLRGGDMVQPWCDKEPLDTLATVRLRLRFASSVPVEQPQLALEGLHNTRVFLNGKMQDTTPTGYFTDEAIQTNALESFGPGEHELLLEIAYHRKSCIECVYLLGDFGVEVRGSHARITEPVRELAFGNWVHQGLPFYAGNVTYHSKLVSTGQSLIPEAAHFGGALVTARVNEGDSIPLAFSPYQTALNLPEGAHRLDLKYLCCLHGGVKHIVSREHIEAGLLVTNWGDAPGHGLAALSMTLLLALLRELPAQIDAVSARGWRIDATRPGTERIWGGTCDELRVGIYGLGFAGRRFVF